MLTIFACPKPFVDPHISTIQRNAIRSWTLLSPTPQVVLFGDEEGTAEVARETGVEHLPGVKRNQYGTPLLSDIFEQISRRSTHPSVCYSNCDIILMNDFAEAVAYVAGRKSKFMMGGRPWDYPVPQLLDFAPGWDVELHRKVEEKGELRGLQACDYFAFPRGFFHDIPPFAVGRVYFDNALMGLCRHRGGSLIDASLGVMAVHQSHGYAATLSDSHYMNNPEAVGNFEMAGGTNNLCMWWHATHRYRDRSLEFDWRGFVRYWDPRALVGKDWHRKNLRRPKSS